MYFHVSTITNQKDSVLLETNDTAGANSLKVSLTNGTISVQLKIGKSELFSAQSTKRVDDERLHRVHIRISDSLLLVVDGDKTNVTNTGSANTCLVGELVIGSGSDQSASSTFTGCITNLFVGQDQPLESAFSRLSPAERDLIRHNKVSFGHSCKSRLLKCPREKGLLLVDPTSATSMDHVDLSQTFEVFFELRAEVPNGLVLSILGVKDFLFLQIIDRTLCINASGSAGRAAGGCITRLVSNKLFSKVTLRKTALALELSMEGDGVSIPFNQMLDVRPEVIFGYFQSPCYNKTDLRPQKFNLNLGITGCVGNVRINSYCVAKLDYFTCSTALVSLLLPDSELKFELLYSKLVL